jgi:CubicO group peptidase (beta-lactamase class C family)
MEGQLGVSSPPLVLVLTFRRHSNLGQALRTLIVGGLLSLSGLAPLCAAESNQALETRIQGLIPQLETYIADGMKAFDVPGLGIGIVAGDELVYAEGFGVRSKSGGEPVSPGTVFQIASTSKAFLAATMAIAVDHGKLHWDDRIIDLVPDFQLKDAWVTRELRVFDIIAQRSGLATNVNDTLGYLGFDADAMVRSLRFVDTLSSFRSAFTYTNVTHILAGRLVASAENAPDWGSVLQSELFDALGMKSSSYTRAAIEAAHDHAQGHRYSLEGSVEIPFTDWIPYRWGGAGAINSTVEDMAQWLRLQLGNGTFQGRSIVSAENLAFTRTPKVADSEKETYAMGWFNTYTPSGTVVWHNGGADGFGAYVGLQLARGVGIVVLTNENNVGFPDAVGAWLLDRVMGNPEVDYATEKLEALKVGLAQHAREVARPSNPRPFPPLGPLAGKFASAIFGDAEVALSANSLVMTLKASGAELELEPWDGDIFRVNLLPKGPFAAVTAARGRPIGSAQFRMAQDGKLGLLELTVENGQSFEFRRE